MFLEVTLVVPELNLGAHAHGEVEQSHLLGLFALVQHGRDLLAGVLFVVGLLGLRRGVVRVRAYVELGEGPGAAAAVHGGERRRNGLHIRRTLGH